MKKLFIIPVLLMTNYVYAQNYNMVSDNACAYMEINTDYGNLPRFNFKGTQWIEGRNGQEYKIQIINNCPTRVMAIVSVDGLNVLNGERANFRQSGYVLNPSSSYEIRGWRKSNQSVANFYFTYPEDSYSNRVGKNTELGVIGAAFFAEKQENFVYPMPRAEMDNDTRMKEHSRKSNSPSVASASREMSKSHNESSDLGTGWGDTSYSPVYSTSFIKESSNPFSVIKVKYDTYENLVRIGAIPYYYHRNRNYYEPDAFPGEYAPEPPRRWR